MNMNINDIDFESIGSDEAKRLGPFGPDDKSVIITCYGEDEHWNSRKAAYKFYKTAALCCDGSEADRYWTIVNGLEQGLNHVYDMD